MLNFETDVLTTLLEEIDAAIEKYRAIREQNDRAENINDLVEDPFTLERKISHLEKAQGTVVK